MSKRGNSLANLRCHYKVPPAPPDRLPTEHETINLTPALKPDYKINTATGCWEWQKSVHPRSGYPMGSNVGKAHRAYYERAHGPIPPDHDIHHVCDTIRCVNPAHLRLIHARDHDLHHMVYGKGRSLELIREVRAEGRRPGASYREVAARYGIHFNTVRRWWTSESWADILRDGPVITPAQTCALEECDTPCSGRRDKRFCCALHRQRHNDRKARAAKRARALLTNQKPSGSDT